jgi:LAGLIDADG endonuclease/Glycosyltransferase family 10 (fucosyltransferase) C-term
MVTLIICIGLYAEKFEKFFGPLGFFLYNKYLELFGKIQIENEQSAGNSSIYFFIGNNKIETEELYKLENLHISDHLKKHAKPQSEKDIAFYLAGLIENKGNFSILPGVGEVLEIPFKEKDIFLAYFIKKIVGYGSVKKISKLSNNFGRWRSPSQSLLDKTESSQSFEDGGVIYILKHKEGLIKLLNLINGKFLSYKIINQLLINKFDVKFNINILPPYLINPSFLFVGRSQGGEGGARALPSGWREPGRSQSEGVDGARARAKAKRGEENFDLKSNYWLTGFADTIAKFQINMDKDILKASNLNLEFSIKYYNKELLELIQQTFGGNIIESENNFLYYTNNFKSAKLLIDYLDKFQLNSSNFVNYFKWRKVYRIVQRNEHVIDRGFIKISKIQKNLRD